jgi:hypothetical protein
METTAVGTLVSKQSFPRNKPVEGLIEHLCYPPNDSKVFRPHPDPTTEKVVTQPTEGGFSQEKTIWDETGTLWDETGRPWDETDEFGDEWAQSENKSSRLLPPAAPNTRTRGSLPRWREQPSGWNIPLCRE